MIILLTMTAFLASLAKDLSRVTHSEFPNTASPDATPTFNVTPQVLPTDTPTVTNTAMPIPTQLPTRTLTPAITKTPLPTATEKLYAIPSPEGMSCEVEPQWNNPAPGHEIGYGCFAVSCYLNGTYFYGNNATCQTPWPYEWDYYHPLREELDE